MTEHLLETKELPATLLNSNAYSEQRISEIQDNLAVFINNIVFYCKLEQRKVLEVEQSAALVDMLKGQLNELWFQQKLKKLSEELQLEEEKDEVQLFEKKLYQLQQIIRAVNEQKNNVSSQEKYISYENQVNKYIQYIESFLAAKNILEAIDNFQLYSNSKLEVQSPSKEASEIDIPQSHFFRELINTKINYGPSVFNYIRPENHQYYISEAARVYNEVAPFKLKHISLSIADGPTINRPNYFQQDLDETKSVLSICLPGTNKLGYYYLTDLCKVHTFGKELYHEKTLSNDWNFSPFTKSTITPNGKIYAVNCRTTKAKIDSYFYQIGQSKASNRGPLPSPKRDSSILHMNGNIYLIGGQGQGQKCSKKNFRYSIKQKKWHQLSQSNVGLRKATICSVNNRYILKLGGLNEFDYVNKIIEMYDSLTDRWSLVRASPRNILQQVQILEDSHAVQISDDQVYIFGGKNANKFSTDTGFVLLISQIKQKRKGAAKVSGQFWNVSVGKRNILTFFGQFFLTSVVIHYNCIYGLRSDVANTISP